MDAFVTARVPVELKSQVAELLASIGSSQSELVNAAFSYVLATGKLPKPEPADSSRVREITPGQREDIRRLMRATTVPVPEEAWGGKSYKDLIAEGRLADYEAVS